MDTEIILRFHPQGLRSYIEVDLCARCPRQDNKGCCGYYSPVFYPTDLFHLQRQAPELIELIWSLPHLTILDHSVTVNSFPDDEGGYYCQFHSRSGGCRLLQEQRESICRHFVCPGINWQSENSLSEWKSYFDQLETQEIRLNQLVSENLTALGLSLRDPKHRSAWFQKVDHLVPDLLSQLAAVKPPNTTPTEVRIMRELKYGSSWPL